VTESAVDLFAEGHQAAEEALDGHNRGRMILG
jgi:hypothetical protein